ncbi:MAG: hypothetical protein MUP69_10210 [Candidatus Atribacteria bacterium]|nr:hypothetical protein [Candidatus Atribacteria bacterium]
MKFYSQITNKPNAVITQVKDGLKLVSSKQLGVFINGELETNDPELIKKLQSKPDMFRTDHPWNEKVESKVDFKTIKYDVLVDTAKKLGIKTYGMKKEEIIEALEKGSDVNVS